MEQISYNSTRGSIRGVSASEAILMGIAKDGGLFVPSRIPEIENVFEDLKYMNYKQLAHFIMSKFLTDFSSSELTDCIDKAYDEKFDSKEIAPVKEVGDVFFLELYHGPTIAFKDMALSILPHLLKTAAKKQRIDKDIVILTATSGDTGKAALEGFSNVEGTKIIVFFPVEGVSEIQKRQMNTHYGNNTYVMGVRGNFDDCQTGVKNIFSDKEFGTVLEKKGYLLSSANSINIGRLIPQIVYYFYAYLHLLKGNVIEPEAKINIAVPTGNFGNILAAYYAKAMGLPINKLICASNENKVLYDFINTGRYDSLREFMITISPSMDILISSNLERLLYVLNNEDTDMIKQFMELLKEEGSYEIPPDMKEKLNDFYSGFASESDTHCSIKKVYDSYGYLIDTHTAVAYSVYKKYLEDTEDRAKTIIVSTASPYKFTSAVMSSLKDNFKRMNDFELIEEMNILSGVDIPSAVKDIESRPVLHKSICSINEMKQKVTEILGI